MVCFVRSTTPVPPYLGLISLYSFNHFSWGNLIYPHCNWFGSLVDWVFFCDFRAGWKLIILVAILFFHLLSSLISVWQREGRISVSHCMWLLIFMPPKVWGSCNLVGIQAHLVWQSCGVMILIPQVTAVSRLQFDWRL